MKKVAIVGAGFVGGTTAMRIAESGLASVVLLDVVESVAKAKAFDLEDARYALGCNTHIQGSSDMSLMGGADVVVVTAGLPRKPGMTREDLLSKNAAIMTEVCRSVAQFAPESIVIVVSNPLDVMTYLAFKKLNFPRRRVFGMGANLDSSRFANLISKKVFVGTEFIKALVIGSHGETMLPLPRLSMVRDKPLMKILKKDEIDSLVMATKGRGAEIVALYGTGSAYWAPSAAIFEILEVILSGRSKEIPVSAYLQGEYGQGDLCIGVPCKITGAGLEEVVELDLDSEEKEAFENSVQNIRDAIKSINL